MNSFITWVQIVPLE